MQRDDEKTEEEICRQLYILLKRFCPDVRHRMRRISNRNGFTKENLGIKDIFSNWRDEMTVRFTDRRTNLYIKIDDNTDPNDKSRIWRIKGFGIEFIEWFRWILREDKILVRPASGFSPHS